MSAPPSSSLTGAPGRPEPALDYRAGLERMMGDQAMYQRVLARFHADYRDKAAHLRKALGAGDLPLAQRIAHTLKGAAAMIEARLLRQLAAELEHALRASAGVDPELVERMDAELARVMAQLDVLLQRASKPGEESKGNLARSPVSGADLARLCAMLDLGDSAAQDYIEDHLAGLVAVLGVARMAQLQAAMAGFDCEGALRVLRAAAGHQSRPASISG